MESKTCAKCGARWFEGQHYWSTGSKGSEDDLAAMVCDNLLPGEEAECINPKRGTEHLGNGWEYRRGFADGLMTEFERAMKNQKPE